MIIEKIENLRDLGGIINKDGRRIRPRMLIRSGYLYGMSDGDAEVLRNELEVCRVIDLRSDLERKEKPDRELEGIENIHLPVFSETVLGISRDKKSVEEMKKAMWFDMTRLYRGMVQHPEARAQLNRALRLIMENPDGSVLWHCSAGKDRAGLTAALVLYMLNVDKDTIFEDYLRSNTFARPFAEMIYKRVLDESGDAERAGYLRDIFVADRAYLEASFGQMDIIYGGIDGYLHSGLGIDDERIEAFREKCLE